MVTHYFYNPPLLVPPRVPTERKKNVLAYINRCDCHQFICLARLNQSLCVLMLLLARNCGAQNGRNDIVAEVQKMYPVEAYGCLGSGARVDKIDIFSKSKVG